MGGGDGEGRESVGSRSWRRVGRSEEVSEVVSIFMGCPLQGVSGATFYMGADPVEARFRCIAIDGAQEVED